MRLNNHVKAAHFFDQSKLTTAGLKNEVRLVTITVAMFFCMKLYEISSTTRLY